MTTLRARVTGEDFKEFSAEGLNISEVFRDAEEKLKKSNPGNMPDFTIEWISPHIPKVDDDIHRWLKTWSANAGTGSEADTEKRLLRRMIAEYEDFAEKNKILRP